MYNPFPQALTDLAHEHKLVAKAQQDDREALETLTKLHHAWIVNIILRMVPDFHQAEDLCQETVIKCFTRLSTFRGKSRFRT